jgi:hypothetical protein
VVVTQVTRAVRLRDGKFLLLATALGRFKVSLLTCQCTCMKRSRGGIDASCHGACDMCNRQHLLGTPTRYTIACGACVQQMLWMLKFVSSAAYRLDDATAAVYAC